MAGAVADLVYEIEALPAPGTEAVARRSSFVAGGGFNAMAAARRAGVEVAYGGGHGEGMFADLVRAEIARLGIPLLLPRVAGVDQGHCVVLVDATGERTFVSKGGAEGIVDEAALAAIDPGGYDWILLSGYPLAYPESRTALHRWVLALPPDAPLVFDPAPVVAGIPPPVLRDVLARTRWLSLNLREAETVVGPRSPADSAARLVDALGGKPTAGVVLREGRAGCRLVLRGEPVRVVAGFEVKTVDTTGAGDAHIGAFLAALGAGHPPVDAAIFANAAAALSTTRRGSATAPDLAEIRAFLAHRGAVARRTPNFKRKEPKT